MPILRKTLWFTILAVGAGLCGEARAQHPATTHQFGGAGFWEPDHLGLVQPQIPLNYFEPDYQLFAPADVDTFGGYPKPNIGFFFTYERLYWNVQRSETKPNPYEGDFTWGNRVEFGYMMDTDHGWLVSAFHLDGPNVPGATEVVFDEDTEQTITTTSSQNNGDFEGVELNKTFRWKPVGRNYIIEPMIGARFMKFIDRDPEITTVTEAEEVDDDDGQEIITTVSRSGALHVVENNMLGGQLGVRIHHQTERWITAIESKFVPAINYQFYPAEDFSEFTIYGQVRMSATYKLTRDISIGGGFDIMHFGRGIARGRQTGVALVKGQEVVLPQNDQDLTIGGFHMMLQINR